jgi:hypothetical protein
MSLDDRALDEQVWKLMEFQTPREIAETLGIERSLATRIVVRLTRTRGTPGVIALGEKIAKLRAIQF